MQDYRNLEVWRQMHQVTLAIYRDTVSFPSEERFGLVSQLRRAAASVGANLAEGCGRGSDADFARFVQMASGSASEVDYHLLLARDLSYITAETYGARANQLASVRRMLSALLTRLRPKLGQ
ncbi:MAG: four helix bundle protein [Planctomycetota bacterium]